jgi:Ran GTPase-activating protein (RanGAP) involved in mRNA processing and transport
LVALSESQLVDRLTVLEMQNTGIGDRGVTAMAESSLLERVVGPGLNFSMNPISDPGAKALAKCGYLAPFSELILRDCRIGDPGARALAESGYVANLAYLDLWKNRIRDAGASALAASKHLGKVRALSLRDNAITTKGARLLQKRFGERVKV